MNSIFITGSSGFVGLNLIEYLSSFFVFINYQREAPIEINQDIVIHLAGKAHDLKKTSNPDLYYQVNTEFTKKVFDTFLASDAKVFITLRSVKAVSDEVEEVLAEEHLPRPVTHYGRSKLLAEQYIFVKRNS
jgi:nucleoside-diphosphate-sugar epimerase